MQKLVKYFLDEKLSASTSLFFYHNLIKPLNIYLSRLFDNKRPLKIAFATTIILFSFFPHVFTLLLGLALYCLAYSALYISKFLKHELKQNFSTKLLSILSKEPLDTENAAKLLQQSHNRILNYEIMKNGKIWLTENIIVSLIKNKKITNENIDFLLENVQASKLIHREPGFNNKRILDTAYEAYLHRDITAKNLIKILKLTYKIYKEKSVYKNEIEKHVKKYLKDGNREIIDELTANSIDIQDAIETLWREAINSSELNSIELIIQTNPDIVNLKDSNGKTALSNILYSRNNTERHKIIKLLVENGAEDLPDKKGNAPSYYAAMHAAQNNMNVGYLKLLIDNVSGIEKWFNDNTVVKLTRPVGPRSDGKLTPEQKRLYWPIGMWLQNEIMGIENDGPPKPLPIESSSTSNPVLLQYRINNGIMEYRVIANPAIEGMRQTIF